MAINFKNLDNLTSEKLSVASKSLDLELSRALENIPSSLDSLDSLDSVPSSLVSQQSYLTDTEKAFKAETNELIRKANEKVKLVKDSENYASLVNKVKKKLRLTASYTKNAYDDLPIGSIGLGSFLKATKKSKIQVLDDMTNSFINFATTKPTGNFNSLFRSFIKSDTARVPIGKVNLSKLRSSLSNAYSIIEDYRGNSSKDTGPRKKIAKFNSGDTVVAKMAKISSNGTYLLPMTHMPSLDKYDPAIGAMFRLFKDIKVLETTIASTGARIKFSRDSNGYKLIDGSKIDLSDYKDTKYRLPTYFDPIRKKSITSNSLSLDRALGIAKDDLTVGNGLGFVNAKAYFAKVVYNKQATRQRANNVYKSYAKKLLSSADLTSLNGILDLPIGTLKQKIKLDAEKQSKVSPLGKLEYSSLGQALMDALEYDVADNRPLKSLFKSNKDFLPRLQVFMKEKAAIDARKKVSIKIADIQAKYGEGHKKELFDYLFDHIKTTFNDKIPTNRTFEALTNADGFLYDLQKSGKLDSYLKAEKKINYFGFNRLVTTGKGDLSSFLDAEGYLHTTYLESLIRNGVLHDTKIGEVYKPEVLQQLSSYVNPIDKIKLAEAGPAFSPRLVAELEAIGIKNKNAFVLKRGLNRLLEKLIPSEYEGAGIVHEGWATRGLLGDEYLFSQFEHDTSIDSFKDIEANLPGISKRKVRKEGEDLGLNQELTKAGSVTLGNNEAVNALNTEINDLLTRASGGRINPESLYKYFSTTRFADGVVPSVIQQLWANHDNLSIDELDLLHKLGKATGFASKGSLLSSKEITRLFNNHLLPLQTEINSINGIGTPSYRVPFTAGEDMTEFLPRTVSIMPSDKQIRPELIRKAIAGEVIDLNELNKPEMLTGLEGVSRKGISKGKLVYSSKADLIDHYTRLSGFTKKLFGSNPRFRKLTNYWQAQIDNPGNNKVFGSNISTLELKLLRQASKYITTSNALPGTSIESPFGGQLNTANFSYDKLDKMPLDRRLKLQESFAESFGLLEKVLLGDQKVYPILSNISVFGPKDQTRNVDESKLRGLALFDRLRVIKSATERPGLSSLSNKKDIEASFNMAGFDISSFNENDHALAYSSVHKTTTRLKGMASKGITIDSDIMKGVSLIDTALNSLQTFSPENTLALKGLQGILSDSNGSIVGSLTSKGLKDSDTLDNIASIDKLHKLGKARLVEKYKAQQLNDSLPLLDRIYHANNLGNQYPPDQARNAVNKLLMLKKMAIGEHSLDSKVYSSLAFSLTKPDSQFITTRASFDPMLDSILKYASSLNLDELALEHGVSRGLVENLNEAVRAVEYKDLKAIANLKLKYGENFIANNDFRNLLTDNLKVISDISPSVLSANYDFGKQPKVIPVNRPTSKAPLEGFSRRLPEDVRTEHEYSIDKAKNSSNIIRGNYWDELDSLSKKISSIDINTDFDSLFSDVQYVMDNSVTPWYMQDLHKSVKDLVVKKANPRFSRLDEVSKGKLLNRLISRIPKFANGGYLPGKSIKDEVPALLMKGETVLTQKTSKELGINSKADYERFKQAVSSGKLRGLSEGGNLDFKNLSNTGSSSGPKSNFVKLQEFLASLEAGDFTSQAHNALKSLRDASLTTDFKTGYSNLSNLAGDSNDYLNSQLNDKLNRLFKDDSFVMALSKDETKNLLKTSAVVRGMDMTKLEGIFDSVLDRLDGDKGSFSTDTLNSFSSLSKGERLAVTKLLSNNLFSSDAFGQLVSQSDRFSHARSWYESNGMDTRGGFDIPKSSIFTTNANIDSTTKLLKDLYKNQELASKLGLDTVKMVGDITNEQDFIKKYINDKDAFKENILDPYSKNTKVVQSAISGLDDHDINRAKKIVGGLTGVANAIDPDDVGVEVKGDNISAAANAAQGFRNSAVTRWANFKEQMMQNAAYMAGYGALSLPIAAGASVMSGAIEFENSLKNLQAVTGSTSEQMNLMSKSIKQVSVDTKFSATEISGAATILGQAGFSAADISASLSGIVKLATATGSSLEDSTNTITSALTVWDRPLTDSGSMANEMTAAINKSKLDMGSITSSVQYAGNIAAQGGIPLTDLLTMTSLMKDAGIKQPSTIATGSRLVYSDFMAPSKKFAKSLKDASIQLEDFQSVFENGGIIETVKFLKSKGYGFAEASKGMEVRERVAFTAMLNQIDKADSFKASITGTQAADTANSVQMKSFTNSFKNMLNSWQVEMNTASEGLLGSLAKGARFLTKEVPDNKQGLFRPNEELVSNPEWTGSIGSALAGVGLGGAIYIGSKKLLNNGSMLDTIDIARQPKTAKALGLLSQTGGVVSKGTSWVGKRLPYIGAGTGVAIDTYDSYQESGIGAAIIDGIGSTLKEVIPTVSAFLAAPFGGPTGVGNLAAGVAGYGVGSSIQSALGLDDLVDKGTNATKKAVLGGPNQDELYRSFLARSESQSNLISDLSKYSKILDDDKLFKLQASDKENTDTAKINRQAKEQGAYNKALELDTIYAEQLAVLSKPMSFTSGVYDSYNATGGKVSAQQKLAENTENIAKAVANKVVETQTKKLPSTAPHLGDIETLDKQKTKASVLAYLASEGTKDFSEMASKNPLAYLTNSETVKKDLETYLNKAMEHTGKFTEEEIKAFTATQVKKMDSLFESNNLSTQPRQVLDAMEQAIKKDPTLVNPIRGNKLLTNIKAARQNVYLEESGFNKFKDKVQEYRSLVADSNKETFKVVSKIADSVNDFNFKAVASVGQEGYNKVSSLAKILSIVNDDFNDNNNLKLLGKYGGAGLAKAINKGSRDSIEQGSYLPSLSKLGESKIKAFDSLGESAYLLTSYLIKASESADLFAKNKLLTGSKSKAIANNDMIDYNFSKALEQAFVSKGVQVDSIDTLLATDISTLKVGDRGNLAKLFDSDFNKKLSFQKQTAIEDIDYNANLQKRNSTRDYEFSKQVNDLQMSFKTQDIERNRQHNIEEAGINFERQVASIGRQRGYAINGARTNLAHNLYQIGVNFQRSLQKLDTDRSRSMDKLATDISRAQQKIETDKTRNEAGARLGYSRGLEDLGTNKTRNIEDASKNLARNLEDLANSVARSKEKLNTDIARSTADANVSYNRQVTAIQQSMADTVTMFERSLTKPVNIQLDPESLIKVADNIDNLSLAMDAHKASLEANTSAVKQYLGINQSKEDLVKGAYIQAYKASGGDVNSDTFKTSYEEYMKSNGSQLVDTVLGYGLDTALAGGVDLTRALSDPTYLANMVANPTDGVATEDAVINSGMTADQLVTALLGNGQGQYTIQTTQGVVLEAKGDMEGALFDLESQMINFGFSLRDAATNLSYAITDIQTSFDRALEDILTNEQQQLEDINLGFSRAIADIELAYNRGLEDLNLSLTRNFADIALQYQYALEDLRLYQLQSISDVQLTFSQALDDLKLNTEWQRQDAITSFRFALQEIEASYQQSLNEAAIDYQTKLNDINRNAAWQLSETFINNEQNKQVMELQFQQLLTNLNLATDESKANIERQLGQQLASVVLDLQAMRTSIETQFRTSLSSTVFDLTIAMTKLQEGLNKAASEADIDLSELRHKIEVAFNSLANDEKIKASFDKLGVTFEEIKRTIEEGGNDLDTKLRELESKFRDAANSLNNTATNASSAASAADIVGDSIEDLKDSTGEIRTDFIGTAADASSIRSTLQSTSSNIQQSGVLAMNSASSAGQMSLQAVSTLAQMLAQAEAQIRSIQARATSFSPDYASVGAVIPGYGGGDILPFMLEPGEAVVRKEAVRALGADFFRQLNSSPSSLSQGLITGSIGLEQSTQSTTAMTSGYNINIQVAPDASLSTIERNIDKIAHGVRQVFEEYL